MENNYRQFKFILRTLGPIHIGSGDKYTSREFLYENKKYYFPDMGSVYSYFISEGLDTKFEQFLLDSKNKNKGNRLNSFFADNRIFKRDFGGYSLKETGLEKEKTTKGSLNDISKFVRDAFGKPYIPGSSLKGAIRTILLNTEWKNTDFTSKTSKGVKENRHAIPWGGKRKTEFNDIFNEIRVSDSPPLENNKMIIVQKWDYSSKAKSIPLYRESIEPFTVLEFTITTTTERSYRLISQLPQLAKEFYAQYQSFFLNEFPDRLVQNNLQFPIYLGGGSGVWTKTIIRQANGIVQKRYIKSRTKMIRKGVMKLTKALDKKYRIKGQTQEKRLLNNTEHYYEMGKACFILKEIKK